MEALEISKALTAKGQRENVRRAIPRPEKATDSSLEGILRLGMEMNSPEEILHPGMEMNSPKAPRPIRQLQNDRSSGWNLKNKGGSDCASTLVPSLQQDAYRYNQKRTAALRQLLSDIRFYAFYQ